MPDKELSTIELGQGVERLKKRVGEVMALQRDGVDYDDQRVTNAENQIVADIAKIWGESSTRYEQNRHHEIWRGAKQAGMSPKDIQARFLAGIPQTITLLNGLISELKDRIEEQHPTLPPPKTSTVKIFISHAWKDRALMQAFDDLLFRYFEIPAGDLVRCTSLPHRGLQVGSNGPDTIRSDLSASSVVVGFVSSNSMESNFVLMELGAAWAFDKTVCLVIHGGSFDLSPTVFKSIHAVTTAEPAGFQVLLDTIERKTGFAARERSVCSQALQTFERYVAQHASVSSLPLSM